MKNILSSFFLKFARVFFGCFLFFLAGVSISMAADLTSSSFIIRDPVVGTGGGYYSSGTFQLFGSGATLFTGYGTSAGFKGKFGFLYFPVGTPAPAPPPPPPTPPPTPPSSGGGSSASLAPTTPPPIIFGPDGCRIADFNCDGKVNILDLSILLYYSDKTGPQINPYDLSEDGKIDLEDISIMFYYWDL